MDHTQLTEEDIQFVDELVRKAGSTAAEMREGVGVHTKSGPNDLVTDADLKVSRIIIAALRQRFPDDLIVSEEDMHDSAAEPAAKPPARVWLIDPIDGTRNYVNRDGQYSSMIGLLHKGKPYYGWIYQPSTATLYSGGPGFGAWKQADGHKCKQFRETKNLAERKPVRVMLGWGDQKRHPWVLNLPNVDLVPSESLGLKIMRIMEDTADIFVSMSGRVKLWDTAAPCAIALGNKLDVGTIDGEALPFPIPNTQHGTSVIIGRPGSLAWAVKNLQGRATRSVPKTLS